MLRFTKIRGIRIIPFFLLIHVLSASPAHSETVTVYTYHVFPPFILDEQKKTGLSFDLAKILSDQSNGKYQFEVEVLPRLRLDKRLSTGGLSVVFWVNNVWFGDSEKTKYLWSKTLVSDRNSVLSPVSKPVEYESPESLIGMKLVGLRGHRYKGVDALEKQNVISRLNVNSMEAAIRFIASGRADITIQPYSSARFFTKNLNFEDKVHFSTIPHSRFDRYILVQPDLQDIYKYIEKIVDELPANAKWKGLLNSYGLE